MPSLRRTVSESASAPRASPYPSSLSLSAASAINAGFPFRPPRRVASETSRRRVLADIEWWRILDGQQEENDSGNGDGNENVQDRAAVEPQGGALAEAMQDTSVAAAATTLGAAAVMDPVEEDAGAAVASPDASQGASSLTTPFANLSISPPMAIPMAAAAVPTVGTATIATPPMTPPRSRRNASESPASSAASTPQSSPRTPEQHQERREKRFMDAFGFDFEDGADGDDLDFCSPTFPPFLTIRGTKGLRNLGMMRSTSLDGGFFDAHRESSDERFGDLIFL